MRNRELTVTITGPFGSGKSTVLTVIEDALVRAGIDPADITVSGLDPVSGAPMRHMEHEPADRRRTTQYLQQGGKLQPMKIALHSRTFPLPPTMRPLAPTRT